MHKYKTVNEFFAFSSEIHFFWFELDLKIKTGLNTLTMASVCMNLSQRGPVFHKIVLKVNKMNIVEAAIYTATQSNILNNYAAARKHNKSKPNDFKDPTTVSKTFYKHCKVWTRVSLSLY